MRARLRDRADRLSLGWLSAGVLGASGLVLLALGVGSAAWLLLAVAALCCLVSLALAVARQRQHQDVKLSSELTLLSERLLRLEAAAPAPSSAPDAATSNWQGLAADMEVLGGLVADLAATVEAQDERIRELRAEIAAGWPLQPPAEPPVAEPAPAAPAEPAPPAFEPPLLDLSTRDNFTRTAEAILERLAAERPRGAPADAPAGTDDAAIVEALDQGRLHLILQPVVNLPQRQTRFFQAEPQLRRPGDRDGELFSAQDVVRVLSRRGLGPELDGQFLARVFAVLRQLGSRGTAPAFSCPVQLGTLRDRRFVEDAAALLAADAAAACRLMLAVPAETLATAGEAEPAALARLRALGPTVMLTGVADAGVDWRDLARRGVSVASIEAVRLLSWPPAVAEAVARGAASAGIRLVAAGVDRELDLPDLIELDIPLAQGAALGVPRPVRIGLAAEPPAAPAEAARPPAAPATAGPTLAGPEVAAAAPVPPLGRLSLRDVLRRAG